MSDRAVRVIWVHIRNANLFAALHKSSVFMTDSRLLHKSLFFFSMGPVHGFE